MKREDAIRNIAIALGWPYKDVERVADNLANPMEQLLESRRKADALFAQIESLAKRERQEPRIKVSPYAKFDKYHKKKKRK
ncbi:MAG: hypothetical protein K2K82_08755 [Muribaculaceae bacterium]|nr:hypothetical protein [Muribaculaceae bacterium]